MNKKTLYKKLVEQLEDNPRFKVQGYLRDNHPKVLEALRLHGGRRRSNAYHGSGECNPKDIQKQRAGEQVHGGHGAGPYYHGHTQNMTGEIMIQIKASTRLSALKMQAFVISEKDAVTLLKTLGIRVGKAVSRGGHYTTFRIEPNEAREYEKLLTKKFGQPRDAGFGAAKVKQWYFDEDSDDSICISAPSSLHDFFTLDVIGT